MAFPRGLKAIDSIDAVRHGDPARPRGHPGTPAVPFQSNGTTGFLQQPVKLALSMRIRSKVS